MPLLDPTYAVIGVGILAVVLGLLWPAQSRRWGTERTMPADPVWEPWAFLPPAGDETPPANAVYRVGEVIETMVRPQIGPGR